MSVPEHQRILPHMDISEQGLRELEIWLLRRAQELQWGPWIYVGTFPTDQNTTSISPPFQNSWRNTGGGVQRLRFRRTVPTRIRKVQSLEVEGDISNTGTLTNSVIFTLPAGYRPSEDSGPVVAANTGGDVVLWEIATNGNVTYVGGATAGAGSVVDSVSKFGDTPLTGDVTFSAGTNVTLTQAGQDIAIAASSSPSTEYDYVETSTGLTVTATTAATAQTFITGSNVTYDGSTRICIEFFSPLMETTSGSGLLDLWDGSTDLGIICQNAGDDTTHGTLHAPYFQFFYTPSAGAHTFTVKAWKTAGTVSLSPDVGGAGTRVKAWIRITKA